VGAEEEDVKFDLLTTPVGIVKEGNKVSMMVFQKCELGESDSSGRRRPVPIKDSEFEVKASFFISAIGQRPSFDDMNEVSNNKDWINVDKFMQTEIQNVWAGGDVLELGLVTTAIYQGRRAAETIHENLRDMCHKGVTNPPPIIKKDKLRIDYFQDMSRIREKILPVDTRLENPEEEIVQGLTCAEVIGEAKRCMSCGFCIECGECWSYCQGQAIIKPLISGEPYKFKMEFCNGCKKCAEICPTGYIEMHMPGQEPVYDEV